ncbi:MAG: glycoside hydrolase family 3 N-terminal domain-containing protein [Bacteroidota bacterium]
MMKRVLKIAGLIVAGIIVVILLAFTIFSMNMSRKAKDLYALLGEEAPSLTIDGKSFRDLNKNGELDLYEDSRADVNDRVSDLLNQMTIEEKAGTMFVTMIGMTAEGDPYDKPKLSKNPFDLLLAIAAPPASEMLVNKKMNSFNIINSYDANILARYNNNVQKVAERMRLGIPITIATDPRHGAENNPGAALFTSAFSQWPNQLGLAATRDTMLVREFADIARQEYRSVGITVALHPMADLATEPRWARINGTFGEDAELSAKMTKAYVLGFQGDSLGGTSVACMTKHFSGGGPQMDGGDPHFAYGKDQSYPGDNFDYHLIPFIEGAFLAKTAQIMPYYGIPVGQTDEDVAFAFNKAIITELLRDSLRFEGVVCTDWGIISDSKLGEARAWGVEDLSPLQRVKKVLDAGCDQFGGEAVPDLIVELVETGQISEERLDQSVRRILLDKYRLGLFENPYVDEARALEVAGKSHFIEKGKEAQAKSMVLLKNNSLLPLEQGVKIYAEGVSNPGALEKYGVLVNDPASADVIVKRINTPYGSPKGKSFLERFFHQGRLYYNDEELSEIVGLIDQKPSIVVAHLERPAILTEISEVSSALLAEFGTSDEVLAEVIFGRKLPMGKLPFELPSSWEAVEKQLEDVPYDSEDPLYEFGYGLTY